MSRYLQGEAACSSCFAAPSGCFTFFFCWPYPHRTAYNMVRATSSWRIISRIMLAQNTPTYLGLWHARATMRQRSALHRAGPPRNNSSRRHLTMRLVRELFDTSKARSFEITVLVVYHIGTTTGFSEDGRGSIVVTRELLVQAHAPVQSCAQGCYHDKMGC
ncbi:hypothetical protein F5X98DRAFT_326876 [Xylaria grammica]|nr:hypothetical protein F5X98DRAFT_326876 [Xylaria grammica]